MIKANELRIGNLLTEVDGSIVEVAGINKDDTIVIYDGRDIHGSYPTSIFKPIPLNEEWLLNKFEFENWGVVIVNEYEKYTRYVLYNVIDGTSNYEVHIVESNYGGSYYKQIIFSIDNDEPQRVEETEYVHNLQNHFKTVTNQELEIKEL